MRELEFEIEKIEFLENIKKYKDIVLSTCQGNIVTSRTVSFINHEFMFYILTSINSNKCKQINENENVSLCVGDLQMEGKAKIIGHPMSESNLTLSDMYKEKHMEYYSRFARYKFATYIEIKCTYIKQWRTLSGKDYFYCLNLIKEKAIRKG